MELEGKNIIYVGGFGGIGEKCVEALLKDHVKSLLIFDVHCNAEYLQYLQNTYTHSYLDYIPMNITNSEDIRNAFQKAKTMIQTFDVVINGAGIVDEEEIDQIVQTNLTGLIHSTLIAMEHMSKSNGGHGGCIINISSIAGLNPTEICCVYGATKSGVLYFTRTLGQPMYYRKTGISFITICPGGTATPMFQQAFTKMMGIKHLPELYNVLKSMEPQSATTLAKNLIKVLKMASNGSTWVLNDGQIEEVNFPEIWGPAMKLS
ncbi:alcohol dehydrogenase-like [Musca vetustissima]|uniref:alcohol dehydrogenase-like n=1 Tax=Musca vetustissima TaxID=27455 RepID=UPI002AB685EE|nr:alcohol dehydrogenase-like [Musca vetustissima]